MNVYEDEHVICCSCGKDYYFDYEDDIIECPVCYSECHRAYEEEVEWE